MKSKFKKGNICIVVDKDEFGYKHGTKVKILELFGNDYRCVSMSKNMPYYDCVFLVQLQYHLCLFKEYVTTKIRKIKIKNRKRKGLK